MVSLVAGLREILPSCFRRLGFTSSQMKNRREFLKGVAGIGALGSQAMAVTEPYDRVDGRLLVGLAAYSFRNHFAYMKGKPNGNLKDYSPTLDMPGFIRYCAAHGVAGAELTSYFFPPEVTTEHLALCRREAHVNGVAISGTAVGNNFSHPAEAPERAEQMAYVREWIDHAAVLGAPHVRVFAGQHPKGVTAEEAEKNAIAALEEAGAYAAEKGIFLGIENHDSISTSDRLLRIVKAVQSPFVGVNLDTGNFISDDVYADMEASAPYAVNVQLKTEIKVAGGKKPADLDRIIGILRDSGYAGYVVVEYEESHDPFVHVPPLLEKLQALCG